MIASEIMTRDVVTVSANECVKVALERFSEKNIRHLPVMRDGILVGVLSDRDLKAYMLPADEAFEHPQLAQKRLEAPAENVIQGDLVTVDPETEVSEIIDTMLDYKVGAVPVVSVKSGKLVGIICYSDILRAAQAVL